MMVAEQFDQGVVRFTLQPNSSLSWQGNMKFLAWMAVVSLSIAGWFAWQGAWLIFPFAGIELIALGSALYLVSSRSLDREVLSIDRDTIEVCKGRWQVESTTCLQRHWVKVCLETAKHDWYPSRLLLRSHGKATEIGNFLDEDEREELAGRLKRVV